MLREPVPENPPSRLYPVSDVVGYLVGRWGVERTVCDLRAGIEGRFRGTADFLTGGARLPDDTVVPEGTVLHVEEGRLTWDGGDHSAGRTLRLRPRPDGAADVAFDDGRPFHDLDLRTGTWTAVHPCAADRYEGAFTARSPDEWHLEWRVSGPAKDQLLRSVYRRTDG